MILESGTLLVLSSKWTWLDIKQKAYGEIRSAGDNAPVVQVDDAILIIMKSSLLLIAADNQMVQRAVILDSGLACMERKLAKERHSVNTQA